MRELKGEYWGDECRDGGVVVIPREGVESLELLEELPEDLEGDPERGS